MPHRRNEAVPGERPFSVRRFPYHRQWAADFDYLKRLPPEARKWLERFAAEYYNSDNDLLRPEKHLARCPKCRAGKACLYRPPPTPLHATDEARRDCYGLKNAAGRDAYSTGRVVLWHDVDAVPVSGKSKKSRSEALRPRVEAGDFSEADNYIGNTPRFLDPRTYRKSKP